MSFTDHPQRYYRRLDSVRAFAVFAVMYSHLWNGRDIFATWGVKLFFVISGFLITQILVTSRTAVGETFPERLRAIGRFYARRFLRIFPLYYLVIGVALIVGLQPTREILAWLLSYLLNFKMASQGYYESAFAHFWSLCVEEQFYLVWPWIIFFIPKHRLMLAACALILGAVGFRALYLASSFTLTTGLGIYILPFGSLDSLGLGAALAIAAAVKPDAVSAALRKLVPCAFALLGVMFIGASISALADQTLFMLKNMLEGIVFCGIVWSAVRWDAGRLARAVLSPAPLVYFGKISYGLYVYHAFAPRLLRWLYGPFYPSAFDSQPSVFFCAAFALTCLVAAISWHFYEAPLNSLKRYFRDTEASGTPAVTVHLPPGAL